MNTPKQNWFNTLNEALHSENLIDLWPLGSNINYDTTVRHIVEDEKNLRLISVYRDQDGRYERPITYLTN